jgi:transcriptional/translational regulatory protein YebC/TACO1
VPKSTVKVTGDDAKKVLDLVDALEEHEDTQNVYANFDIPDDLIKG